MEKFSRALKALWGEADVSHRMFTADSSKVQISRSTLSGWMNGTAPSEEWTKQFFALIRVLDDRAAKKGHAQLRLPEAHWQILLSAARKERARNRGGRPQTTSPLPGPTNPANQTECDRVFREHDAMVEANFRPDLLVAREMEIRELEGFCTGTPEGDWSAYLWWQAGPWAGKTALLAEFAMRHRPPGLEVASCFITDRLGNNTREEFLAEISPQLAAIAGRTPPRRGVRPRALPELLEAAAQACRQRGKRLLLVVDGLDEDALDAGHSIAALLPKSPPTGMLVVVAGRSNPPLPADVPADHPLRMSSVVRVLTPSQTSRRFWSRRSPWPSESWRCSALSAQMSSPLPGPCTSRSACPRTRPVPSTTRATGNRCTSHQLPAVPGIRRTASPPHVSDAVACIPQGRKLLWHLALSQFREPHYDSRATDGSETRAACLRLVFLATEQQQIL
ncbi:ATP-binding protein [Streptomyces sp. AD2-2]|nr:ATP-binding protein [Streptomyces sp. AD2-2]